MCDRWRRAHGEEGVDASFPVTVQWAARFLNRWSDVRVVSAAPSAVLDDDSAGTRPRSERARRDGPYTGEIEQRSQARSGYSL